MSFQNMSKIYEILHKFTNVDNNLSEVSLSLLQAHIYVSSVSALPEEIFITIFTIVSECGTVFVSRKENEKLNKEKEDFEKAAENVTKLREELTKCKVPVPVHCTNLMHCSFTASMQVPVGAAVPFAILCAVGGSFFFTII